jgi:RNase P/RNase MRP subunit POP5
MMTAEKDKARKRYIAFRIHTPNEISRKEFIAAIRRNVNEKNQWERVMPWLTVFENNQGILRCVHTAKDEAITILNSIEHVGRGREKVRVETLGTSGTIKKAKLRFLKNNGK